MTGAEGTVSRSGAVAVAVAVAEAVLGPATSSSIGGALACSMSRLRSSSCLSSDGPSPSVVGIGGGDVEYGRTVSADRADATEAGGPGVGGAATPSDGGAGCPSSSSRTGAEGANAVLEEEDSPSCGG
jgi:hypothetical protein